MWTAIFGTRPQTAMKSWRTRSSGSRGVATNTNSRRIPSPRAGATRAQPRGTSLPPNRTAKRRKNATRNSRAKSTAPMASADRARRSKASAPVVADGDLGVTKKSRHTAQRVASESALATARWLVLRRVADKRPCSTLARGDGFGYGVNTGICRQHGRWVMRLGQNSVERRTRRRQMVNPGPRPRPIL